MAQMIGTVSKLVGKVFARGENGEMRELRLGDSVFQGETLVTASGAVVEISAENAPPVVLSGDREMLLTGEMAVASRDEAADAAVSDETLEAVVAALEGDGDLLEGLEAPAAGGATGGNEGSSFVRLGRIGFDLGNNDKPVTGTSSAKSGEQGSDADNDQQLLANEAPDAVDDEFSAAFESPITGNLLENDTDADGDVLSVISATAPANGTVTFAADGTFTYTPNPDFSGDDTFTYTVDDGNGGTDTATVTITVGEEPPPPPPVNQDPDAVDDEYSGDFESTITGNVLDNDSDPDGDPLNVVGSTNPQNGTLELGVDGTFTYIPDEGFSGEDTFNYTIDDGNGGTDVATVTITIGEDGITPPVNNDPDALDDVYAAEFGETVNGSVLDNDSDPDGDPLTVTGNTDPSNGVVVMNPDGTFTYTPNDGFSGEDSFTYTVDDGNGGTDVATVIINVAEDPVLSNNDPNAVDDLFVVESGSSVDGQLLTNDSDPDGDPLTVVGNTDPGNGVVVVNPDGTFTYTPNEGFSGDDSFTYTVDDGNGGTDVATVTITVSEPTPTNNPPLATDDNYATEFVTPVSGNLLTNDSDPDGDSLTIFASTQPANGTVDVNPDGTFEYTPNPGFSGTDVFSYAVTDGNGGTDTAEVTITVGADPNLPPVAADDTLTVPIDESVVISVLDNDADADGTLDPGSVTIIDGPANGQVTVNADGTVVYTPLEGYIGPDSFTYTVQDDDGAESNVATVSMQVRDFGDFSVSDVEVIEGRFAVITVTRDGDALDEASVTVSTLFPSGPDTASAGDFADTGALLVFFPGVTSMTFVVETFDDSMLEDPETFRVQLTDPTGGAGINPDAAVGTVTIIDNDSANVVIGDARTEEGSSAIFSVTLTQASDEPVDIRFTASVGSEDTAESNDFDADGLVVTYVDGDNATQTLTANADGSFTIPAGVTDLQVAVPTIDDDVLEGEETFTLSASIDDDAYDDSDVGTGTIVDDGSEPDGDDDNDTPDDDRPAFSINDVTVSEDAGTITFTVSLAGASELETSVQYAVAEGSAIEPEDYTGDNIDGNGIDGLAGLLVFPPGVVQQTITLQVEDDALAELSEQFEVALSNASNATIDDGTGVGTITDETDGDTAFTLQLFAVVEGDGGTEYTLANSISEDGGVAEYVVLAVDGDGNPLPTDQQPGGTVEVAIGLPGDDATRAVDYNASATLTATVGTAFIVTAIDDSFADDGEIFSLSLSGDWSREAEFENVEYVSDNVVTTILDDADAITLSFGDIDVAEGSAPVQVSATLSSAPTDAPLVVTLANGATITFDVGETTAQSDAFLIQGDDVYIDPQSFTLAATVTSGGDQFESLVVDGPVNVNVVDTIDDVLVSLSGDDVLEGQDITITATVASAPQLTDLVVTLDNGEQIVIAVGDLSGSVTFTNPNAADDVDDASVETFAIASTTGGNFESLVNGEAVSINVGDQSAPPIANDDGEGSAEYSVSLGKYDDGGSWTVVDSNGIAVDIAAFNEAGEDADVVILSGSRVGVAGAATDGRAVPNQLGYDTDSGTSEALVFSFSGYLNEAEISLSNLIGSEASDGERGTWVALLDGTVVATGTFDEQIFTIDTGALVFNELRFEALPYEDHSDTSTDSSDYLVRGITGTGSAEANTDYVTNEGTAVTLEGVLDNDIDPEGALPFEVIAIDGVTVTVGTPVTLASGATLTVNADGTFSYDPSTASFDLAAGEIGQDSFTYQIANSDGSTLDSAGGEQDGTPGYSSDGDSVATVSISVIGLGEEYVAPVAPVTDDATVTGEIDEALALPELSATDPVDGGTVTGFVIRSLPANGVLLLNGVAVAVDQYIDVADAGSLTFEPDSGWTGDTRFEFAAVDDDQFVDGTPAEMVISIVETVAPVGIDLDNDGVSYLGRDAGVVFTDEQTGEAVNTAWVGPEDGMLVFDANQSGTVDSTSEYVFTEWSETAETDMQALAEVFDTNQDGVLDAQDEQFDQFAVWQDADSDGVTDAGELVSLGDMGIESISLTYRDDSESGTAADGDVVIHGQSDVTWTDGAVTVAEDSEFAITAADVLPEDDSIVLPAGEEAAVVPSAEEGSAGGAVSGGDNPVEDAALLELDILLSNNDSKLDLDSPE